MLGLPSQLGLPRLNYVCVNNLPFVNGISDVCAMAIALMKLIVLGYVLTKMDMSTSKKFRTF